MLHLEVKLKQGKLDWRILKLQFHKNHKSKVFKAGNWQTAVVIYIILRAYSNDRVSFKGYTNITNKQVWLLYFGAKCMTQKYRKLHLTAFLFMDTEIQEKGCKSVFSRWNSNKELAAEVVRDIKAENKVWLLFVQGKR